MQSLAFSMLVARLSSASMISVIHSPRSPSCTLSGNLYDVAFRCDPYLTKKVLETLGIGEICEIYGGYLRSSSTTDSVLEYEIIERE